MKYAMKSLIAASLTLLLCSAAARQEVAATAKIDDAKAIAHQLPSYPLTTCPVSHEALDAEKPVDFLHEGRLVRLCCKGCVKGFKKDPAATLAAIDAAIIAEQGPSYPMTECPMSGEALGSMGDPLPVIHGTRLVKLCCKGCVKGFHKNPEKALAKVDAALIAQQKPTYAVKTCLVSGDELGDDAHDMLYGTRLVRLCCKKCVAGFEKDPATFVAKLDAAAHKAHK
jgi:hypothetical protein